jgi:CRISPR-associated endoribonuclease Cas6
MEHVIKLLLIANNDLQSIERKCQDLKREEATITAKNLKAARIFHYGGLLLGFTGNLKMSASSEVLKFFYQSGIGYRRSNGFGMVELDRR